MIGRDGWKRDDWKRLLEEMVEEIEENKEK